MKINKRYIERRILEENENAVADSAGDWFQKVGHGLHNWWDGLTGQHKPVFDVNADGSPFIGTDGNVTDGNQHIPDDTKKVINTFLQNPNHNQIPNNVNELTNNFLEKNNLNNLDHTQHIPVKPPVQTHEAYQPTGDHQKDGRIPPRNDLRRRAPSDVSSGI